MKVSWCCLLNRIGVTHFVVPLLDRIRRDRTPTRTGIGLARVGLPIKDGDKTGCPIVVAEQSPRDWFGRCDRGEL